MVKLRNPWGQFEWTGDWGDNSDCWTPALRKQLGTETSLDDGSFWMDFEQVKFYFSEIAINKYVESYFFSCLKLSQPRNNFSLIQFKIDKKGEYTFSVSQKDINTFNRYQTEYEYSNCHILMAKVNGKSITANGLTYVDGAVG